MSEYRPSLFDRHGPGAADRVRALSYGLMVFGLAFGAITLGSGRLSWVTLVWATTAGTATAAAAFGLSTAVGGAWTALMMSGASTPYEEQYSYQEALVMQRRVNEALASYEEVIASKPHDAAPRIRAAELYSQQPDGAPRAAELLRSVQRLPNTTAGQDIYATNRLVDLLVGSLGDPGRAVVELRRLVERHPRTNAAAHARDAIARLKQQIPDLGSGRR